MSSDILFQDDFKGLKVGPIIEVVDGPFREMHAQPASPDDNMDGWSRRVGNWSLSPAKMWSAIETDNGKRVRANQTATVYDNASLAKGDFLWRDYKVETTVTLEELCTTPGLGVEGNGWGGPAGVIFRFLDSQRHYAVAIDEDGQAKILKRVEASWDVLAWKKGVYKMHEEISIVVEVKGGLIKAKIGDVELEVENHEFENGCVGFIGARPSVFGPIKVTAIGDEAERLKKEKETQEKRISAKRAKYGKPVVWKKYDTKGFGAGRRIRLGDLTGDGKLDFLLAQTGGQKSRGGMCCLTAMDSEGKVLWQKGEPIPPLVVGSSGDAPFQIIDFDGDGKNEVVCILNKEINILDGATGEVKQTAPLPGMKPFAKEFKQNMLDWGAGFNDEDGYLKAGNISFADLDGIGRPGNILLTDSYHTIVALNHDLTEKWRTVTSCGHYPQSFDFDGNGKADVIVGYHHISHDGKLVGRLGLQDHQDATYIGPLDLEGKGPVKILMAAGEDGLLTLTPGYDIRQRVMGHVQRLGIGRFREDFDGLCVATILFHGNHGIVSLFDPTIKKIWTKDFPVIGATLQPVNWDGSGTELMFLSGIRPSQGYAGGLIDGDGELVVPMPDDGGPGYCAMAHDFDGDGLDELMVWDQERIWIYHTDKEPVKKGYTPVRPHLWNMSNFQCYYSQPKWTQE